MKPAKAGGSTERTVNDTRSASESREDKAPPDEKARQEFEEILHSGRRTEAPEDAMAGMFALPMHLPGLEKILLSQDAATSTERLGLLEVASRMGKNTVTTSEANALKAQASTNETSTLTGQALSNEANRALLPDSIQLRLTQGPLSGMEIHAALESGALKLRLSVADQRRLDKLTANSKRLASVLEDILDCPVVLEVNYVAPASGKTHPSTPT